MFLVRTFNQIKYSRLKQLAPVQRNNSNFCTTTVSRPPEDEFDHITDEKSLIEVLGEWKPEDQDLLQEVLSTMRVLPGFVTESEEAAILAELEPRLRRMRYEFDHWDDAIHGYRETEVGQWGAVGSAVMSRVAAAAFPAAAGGSAAGRPDRNTTDTKLKSPPELAGSTRAVAGGGAHGRPLRAQHVLDLAAAGHIKPHVDAVRFCGPVIAGLCLCSPAVMVLRHESRPQLLLRALLPRRSLYVMSGVSRYEFNHAIPTGKESVWRGKLVPKKRRIAIITRSEAKPEHTSLPGDDIGRFGREIKQDLHITPSATVQPVELGNVSGEAKSNIIMPKSKEPVKMKGDATKEFETLGDSAGKGEMTKSDSVVKNMPPSEELLKTVEKPNPPKDKTV